MRSTARRVIAAVEIGPDFSRDIEAGAPADLQIILDGRRSNASQIVAGYLNQIVATPCRRDAGRETRGCTMPSRPCRATGSIPT